jgi:hypothetical protein
VVGSVIGGRPGKSGDVASRWQHCPRESVEGAGGGLRMKWTMIAHVVHASAKAAKAAVLHHLASTRI